MAKTYWLFEWRAQLFLYLVGVGTGFQISSTVCGASRGLAIVGMTLAAIGVLGLLSVRVEKMNPGSSEKDEQGGP